MANRRNFLKLGAVTAGAAFAGSGVLIRAKEQPLVGGKDFSPRTGAMRQQYSCGRCFWA